MSPAPWTSPRGKRFVDAHHITNWSAGGETSLENLMLLCHAHHKLCHEGGFTIGKDYRERWFFRRTDGRAVPPLGYRLMDMVDDDVWMQGENIEVDPSAEGFAQRKTYPSAEGPLAEDERCVRENSARYDRLSRFSWHRS